MHCFLSVVAVYLLKDAIRAGGVRLSELFWFLGYSLLEDASRAGAVRLSELFTLGMWEDAIQ